MALHQPAAKSLVKLDRAALTDALAPIFEGADLVADAVLGRAVESWDQVLGLVEAYVQSMDETAQMALLNAHPRLGANLEALGRESPPSVSEQYGTATVDTDVLERLGELNDAYEARFSFRFVEFIAGRPLAAVIPIFEARLERACGDELHTGLAAFSAIARNRLGER